MVGSVTRWEDGFTAYVYSLLNSYGMGAKPVLFPQHARARPTPLWQQGLVGQGGFSSRTGGMLRDKGMLVKVQMAKYLKQHLGCTIYMLLYEWRHHLTCISDCHVYIPPL